MCLRGAYDGKAAGALFKAREKRACGKKGETIGGTKRKKSGIYLKMDGESAKKA